MLLSAFILAATNTIAFGMDNKNIEEAIFRANVKKLSPLITYFVRDFKKWPKEEQNKIQTYHLKDGESIYHIDINPTASNYKNINISLYLDNSVSQQEMTPFIDAIEYLKKQQ